jgi:formylglycine-generating enzyme required for sulfatase activity
MINKLNNKGSGRISSGGSWYGHDGSCTVCSRNYDYPYSRDDGMGFRIVRIKELVKNEY